MQEKRFWYQVTLHKRFHVGDFGYNGISSISTYTVRAKTQLDTYTLSKLATWLVLAERLCTSDEVEFGRVCVLQVPYEGGFDWNTPVHLLIPWLSDDPANPTSMRGLRSGELVGGWYSATVEHNRATGAPWKHRFMHAVGWDDMAPVRHYLKHPERFALSDNGPFARYCYPWFRYLFELLEVVDVEAEVDRFGAWKYCDEARDYMMLGTAAEEFDLRASVEFRNGYRALYWGRLNDWERNITALARSYFEYWDAFPHLWNLQRSPMSGLWWQAFFYNSRDWQTIAEYMGYAAPAPRNNDAPYYKLYDGALALATPKLQIKRGQDAVFNCVDAWARADDFLRDTIKLTEPYPGASHLYWDYRHIPQYDGDPYDANVLQGRWAYAQHQSIQDAIFTVWNSQNLLSQILIPTNRRNKITSKLGRTGYRTGSHGAKTYPSSFDVVPYVLIGPAKADPFLLEPRPRPAVAVVTVTVPNKRPYPWHNVIEYEDGTTDEPKPSNPHKALQAFNHEFDTQMKGLDDWADSKYRNVRGWAQGNHKLGPRAGHDPSAGIDIPSPANTDPSKPF